MFAYVTSYLSILVSLVVLDGLWIGLFMGNFFKRHLSHVLTDTFVWWPVGVFYALYALAIAYFIVWRPLSPSVWGIFCAGLFLGLTAYGTYDLTNQATVAKWPVFFTLLDMGWGSFYTGVVAVIGALLFKATS